MIDGSVSRAALRTVRLFDAPTEAEADALSTPTIDAFEAGGWRIDERLWIPGDRRPSLVESMILSPESENLLEANGTLRLTFASDDPNAAVPVVATPERVPDTWEELGGVRYRRLAPRWIASAVFAVIALLLFALFVASMSSKAPGLPGVPGFGDANPDASGNCPIGYLPAYQWGANMPTIVTCQRFP